MRPARSRPRSRSLAPTARRSGWIAVAARAVLALVWLSLLTATTLPLPAAATSLTDANGHVVVCTPAGMVSLGTGSGGDEDSPPASHPLCLLCLPLLHGGALAPAFVATPAAPLALRATRAWPPARVLAVAIRHDGKATPRAPPLG